jgi:hypothetical protein
LKGLKESSYKSRAHNGLAGRQPIEAHPSSQAGRLAAARSRLVLAFVRARTAGIILASSTIGLLAALMLAALMLAARATLLAGLSSALPALTAALLAPTTALARCSLLPARLLRGLAARLARALIARVAVAILRA